MADKTLNYTNIKILKFKIACIKTNIKMLSLNSHFEMFRLMANEF